MGDLEVLNVPGVGLFQDFTDRFGGFDVDLHPSQLKVAYPSLGQDTEHKIYKRLFATHLTIIQAHSIQNLTFCLARHHESSTHTMLQRLLLKNQLLVLNLAYQIETRFLACLLELLLRRRVILAGGRVAA